MSANSYYRQVVGGNVVAVERDGSGPFLIVVSEGGVRREFGRARTYEDAEMTASIVAHGLAQGKRLNYERAGDGE